MLMLGPRLNTDNTFGGKTVNGYIPCMVSGSLKAGNCSQQTNYASAVSFDFYRFHYTFNG